MKAIYIIIGLVAEYANRCETAGPPGFDVSL
jgi:hypothetical protein